MQGERLGAYVIERELGSGGMGKVYAATGPDGVVALKVVHPQLLEAPGFFKRFLREAQIGQSVLHENVVRTLDCDAVGGHHFLVMEYVEGQTLTQMLAELERVPEELCRHVGREICKGLAAIHDAGVVHRDLKPENVLITADHVVKVMDLGVAHLADEQMRLSQTGAFVGSVEYAAPEQFEGGGVDHRCDLHALGLLLYELACGQHPYRGDDFRGVMRRVCDEEPRRAGEVNPQLSAFFEEVVHTLLAKSRDDRFASAAEALAVLEEGEDSGWWHERARQLQATTKRPLRRIRIPRETAVYGRDDELAKLRALYDAAKSGDGQVVLIEGEAGIGKSRLVDELVGRLQADGEDLNFLFGSYPPGGAATAAGAFSTAYREHLGDAGASDHLSAAPILVPAFDALLRGESAPTGVEPLTKDSLQTCFVHVTRALATERPTVVLIDDLHFAPEEGRALFSALTLAVPDSRVLLIGTARPGLAQDWRTAITRLDHATDVELHRLGPKDLAALLQDCFASEQLALSLAGKIGVQSDGNPFFAFEIIRGLREGQFIAQSDDGSWVSTGVIDQIQIPSSVRDLVTARVADLSEEERDLLDVAACWGFAFDPALVGEVVGLARIPALKRFGQIERRHRLVRSVGRHYVFDHHQVQEALLAALNDQLREEYHGALAEALETRVGAANTDPGELDGVLCVDLCEHFLAGARGERALRYLDAARSHLRAGYLHAEEAELTDAALRVDGLLFGPRRAGVLVSLADVRGPLALLGRRERQQEALREVLRLAIAQGDQELQFLAWNSLGLSYTATSRHEEAMEACAAAREIAVEAGNRSFESYALVLEGQILDGQGRSSAAEKAYQRALALHTELGNTRGQASTLGNLGLTQWARGQVAEARANFGEGLRIARDIGDRTMVAGATVNLGMVLLAEWRLQEARDQFERGRVMCREIGHRQFESSATTNLGNVLYLLGCYAEAVACQDRAHSLARDIGYRHGEAVALLNVGQGWAALGVTDDARSSLEAALARCREIGSRYPEGYALLRLGLLADELNDAATARERIRESIGLRRGIGHADGLAEALFELAELEYRNGRLSACRAALDEATPLRLDQGRRPELAMTLALEALSREDEESRERAVAAFDDVTSAGDSPRLRLLMFRATSEATHLHGAKRLLDEHVAQNPPEYHESMLTNVRVNREILAAWEAEIGGEGPDEPAGGGSESATRVG